MQTNEYFSKVDFWLIVVLLVAVSLAILTTGYAAIALKQRYGMIASALPVVLVLIVIFFIGYSVLGIKYTVNDDMVIVQSGFGDDKIPLKDIQKIEPTRDSISSPALSLDRLKITYGKNTIIISPLNKEKFCRDVFERIDKFHKNNNQTGISPNCAAT